MNTEKDSAGHQTRGNMQIEIYTQAKMLMETLHSKRTHGRTQTRERARG